MAKLNVATPNNAMAVVRSLYLSLSILHARTHIIKYDSAMYMCTVTQACSCAHNTAAGLKKDLNVRKSAENTETMYIYERYISEKILLVAKHL